MSASDSQLNKLKTAVKDRTGSALRTNIKMLNGNNLPRELILTTRQTTKLRNSFESNMSTDIKLSKAQISKIIQSGRFLGSLLSKLAGPLMKLAAPLVKSILDPLGVTAAMSAIDRSIQKKIHKGSGKPTLIISIEGIKAIPKITKALEDSNILLKGFSEAIKNETEEQKGGFLSMLLGTLASTLLGNMLDKGIVRAGYGNKQGEGVVRAGYGSSIKKSSNSTTSFNKL